MKSIYTANVTVINSIKMNRRMKSYFLRKYKRIVAEQGEKEATAIFKELREAIMQYVADPNRDYTNHWMKVRMRKNGMLAKLFEYANTNPEQCLAFVKLYATGVYGDANEQVYQDYEESLDSIQPMKEVPQVIMDWLNLILGSECKSIPHHIDDIDDRIRAIRRSEDHKMKFLLHNHTKKHVRAYIRKWQRVFRVDATNSPQLPEWKELCPTTNGTTPILEACRLPLASDYRDAKFLGGVWHSKSFDRDYQAFVQLWENENFPGLGELHWLYRQILSKDFREINDSNAFQSGLLDDGQGWYELIGGTIDLVPKPGMNNQYRAVCALNRILQSGLIPIWMALTHIVEKMPKDCSFDQAKLDQQIQKSVDDMNAYTGCVDLSKATDNLPFAWTTYIIDSIIQTYANQWDNVMKASYVLAKSVSQGLVFTDREDKFTYQWTRGQPLGSKPSFMMLALTHNVILESLAAEAGLTNSPYGVLGDDSVMFSQTVRAHYIELMTQYGVPLSLHKSYEDRMVEFAGKLYVRNAKPFYNTDMRWVYYANLFDYQRVTGVDIPWEQLSPKLRKEIEKKCKKGLSQVSRAILRLQASIDDYKHFGKLYRFEELPVDLKSSRVRSLKTAKSWYNAIKSFYGSDRGTQIYDNHKLVLLSDVYVAFELLLWQKQYDRNKDGMPSVMPKTGISNIGFRTPMETVGNISMREVKPLKREPQKWFKDKYRPETVDVLFSTLADAIIQVSNDYANLVNVQLAKQLQLHVNDGVESTISEPSVGNDDCTAIGETTELRIKRLTSKRQHSSEGDYPTIWKWLGNLIHRIVRLLERIRLGH